MHDSPSSSTLFSAAQASTPFVAGVDVGGTNIKLGLVDREGRTLAYESIVTDQAAGPQSAADRCAEALRRMTEAAGMTPSDIRCVGLATPGPMDIPSGMLVCPGNLPTWHNTPIRDLFAKATGLPVTFANDANAAAYGEFWRGAGADYHSMVMVTLGTGVGGGIILGDRLVDGAHSAGGEVGHIIIDSAPDAPLNSLGIRGTLEGYCGSYGVVGRAEAALADHFVESGLRDSVAGGEKLTPLLIANAAEAGDELALRIVLDTARYLAIGVVTLVHTLDPESVVIGGGMTFGGEGTPLGERFMAETRRQAQERLLPNLRGRIHLDFAQLGGDAGYIGAAGLALRELVGG